MLELYNELKKIAILLYEDDDVGLLRLKNILEMLTKQLLGLAQSSQSEEYVRFITQCVKKINMALQHGDKILAADTLYFEIGMLLANGEVSAEIEDNEVLSKAVDENIYNKNKEALKKNEILYKKLNEYADGFSLQNSIVQADQYGNMILYKDNYYWRLNSIYNRKQAAKYGTKQLITHEYVAIMFIMGLGNTDYIKEVIDNFPKDMIVIIYEPEKEIFAANMYCNNMECILKREKTFLFVEELNEEQIGDYVRMAAQNLAPSHIVTYYSPVYAQLYMDNIKRIIEICCDSLTYNVMYENTIVMKAEQINYNRIKSIPLMLDSIMLSDLKNKLQMNDNLDMKAAIIVAAGPSLDKNIEQLKLAKGRAFILAVDSSIRMLLKHNIQPDVIVTIDPDKERILFENDLAKRTPIIYSSWSTYDAIYKLTGRKIFCNTNQFTADFLKLLDKKEPYIVCGGNVATTAISIAHYLGFENLITIGLDLAFAGDKKHASVAYDDGGINEKESVLYDYVEGQNGEQLLTYKNFVYYKKAIEENMQNLNWNLINATEGGALIKGAISMSLKEAIEKYCYKECNYKSVIENMKNSFTEEDKKKALAILKNCIGECHEISKAFEQCTDLYDKILLKRSVDEIRELLSKIDLIHEKIGKKFIMDMITDYATQNVDKQLAILYEQMKVKDGQSSLNDIQDLVYKGKKVTDAFKEATKHTENLLIETVRKLES